MLIIFLSLENSRVATFKIWTDFNVKFSLSIGKDFWIKSDKTLTPSALGMWMPSRSEIAHLGGDTLYVASIFIAILALSDSAGVLLGTCFILSQDSLPNKELSQDRAGNEASKLH